MKASRKYRRALVLAIAGLALGITGCSSAASSNSGSTTASGAPELPNITIGVLPGADSVTVQIAEDKGFFKQQGLNVKIITETTTNAGTTGLLSHTMDFTSENYVGMFTQEEAVPSLHLKIVADNSQTSPGLYVMMVSKNSDITSLAQLKGKKVGFPAPGFNFGAMAADIQLAPYHLSSANFTTVVEPFSAAQQALATGAVNAIFTTEPFITAAEAAAGDRVLEDMLSGPLAGFPTACWGTTASFTQKYPKTVAAFQRAIQQAVEVAATDPSYVRTELPKFIPTMKAAIAKVITLPTYNTTLTIARMQRVASVVQQTGGLPKSVNVSALVASMYYPEPTSS
jgi:NitT/TauT family transport system substrate-binding protein